MATFSWQDEVAVAVVRQRARAMGMSIDCYLKHLAEQEKSAPYREPERTLSPEHFRQWLDSLSEGLPRLSPLPANFSRGEIYDECD